LDGNQVNGSYIKIANTESITGSTLGRTSLTNNVIKNGVNGIVMTGAGMNDISISGGVIEGTSAEAITIVGVDRNIKISDVSFVTIGTSCIYIDDVTGLTVTGCTFQGCTYGINAAATCADITVANCKGVCTTSFVNTLSASNVLISNCAISGVTGGHAIYFNESNNCSVTGCNISMGSASFDGIRAFGNAATANNIRAIGNVVSGTFGYGMYCLTNSEDITAIGNNFTGATTSPFSTTATRKNYIAGGGGPLTNLVPASVLAATMPTTITAANSAVDFQITGAGSSAFIQRALNIDLLGGYTGSASTQAYRANNVSTGTGTTMIVPACNQGAFGGANGSGTGTNVGVYGSANGGNINVGTFARAVSAKNGATNIGVFGVGINTGTTPIQIGGYFGLHAADPTFESAALIADNGSQTSPIFLARDNGTTVFTIQDGGNTKINGTANRGTTEGTGQLVLFNGTAPVGTLTNGASLYSASGELRVMDAAGNSTLLSPHDHETNEWIYYSKNTVTGKVLRIDMERMLKAIDEKLGGGFIHEYTEEVQGSDIQKKQ